VFLVKPKVQMIIICQKLRFSTIIPAVFNVWYAENAYLATGFLPWPDQRASLNMLLAPNPAVPIPKTVAGLRSA
jgi:hypothetical protein